MNDRAASPSLAGTQASPPVPGPRTTDRRPGWRRWLDQRLRTERFESAPPWRVEGARDAKRRTSDGSSWFWWALLGALVVNWLISSVALAPPERSEVSYTFFVEQVDEGNVAEITTTADTIEGRLERPVRYPRTNSEGDGQGEDAEVLRFTTQRPSWADDGLFAELARHDVVVNAERPDTGPSLWQQLLIGFGPTLLLFGLIAWGLRRAAGGIGGGLGGLGRSGARLYKPEETARTIFADVAGIDEVEGEVREIVDFLRDPDRYRRLGAQIPRGVLLSGPPGTGKTLLARAVAGEANVPFFSVSASEFIEMVVGVGAARVRDLFEQAKRSAPAIIFIDELDAIGRARGGAHAIGGHDEREQTLNQILTEMDGFTGSEGVVVLAATNRPEILDPALLRPGRFDRRVAVTPPDTRGRRQIFDVHVRSVPLATDVDLDDLAASTPGMVGADLKNLVNEAALLAARRRHDRVSATDFSDALEKVVLGTARGITLSPEERERTAYHEAGHALLGMLTPGADPVRKVSIIPRGQALGVTFQRPDTDRYGYSATYLRGRIVGALGGRAAEHVVYGEVTTGAESDLEQVTAIARQMVGRWGMSDAVGPLSVLPRPGDEHPFGVDGVAPATRELVDAEIRRLVEDCDRQAVDTLRSHRANLGALARALLEQETLDEDDAYRAAGIAREHAPGAIARGEAGTRRAAGLPPEHATVS